MSVESWFFIIGGLLSILALTSSFVKRLPLTTSILYLTLGFLLGPMVGGYFQIDFVENSALLERLTEIAVLLSLFTAGLKLRVPLTDPKWITILKLAFGSMLITVGMITAVGYWFLHLPLGAAVLLGAVLAPTDPVLASDIQVQNADDHDALRFSLTGEAGLNDGTAFPFVMLGLGLLGLHDLGTGGWRWWAIDLFWACLGGLAIGWSAGLLTAKLLVHLRRQHREAIIMDDFLALGLIGVTYGLALLFHTYGFLAVFAAGLAFRHQERQVSDGKSVQEVKTLALVGKQNEIVAEPNLAPAYTAQAVLFFNEHLERLGEVGIVLILGGMISVYQWQAEGLWFIPLLFMLIRPVSVALAAMGTPITLVRRIYTGWFGVRGVGSLYYLSYSIEHGLSGEIARSLTSYVLMTVVLSIVIHGISMTPFMNLYGKFQAKRSRRDRKIDESA